MNNREGGRDGATETVFSLEEVGAGYNGVAVLEGICLDVHAGERVALVGRSGAGKSTLLSLLYRQQQARCALIPQEAALVRSLSVFHNIYMGTLHKHSSWYNVRNLVWPVAAEVQAVTAVAADLGLGDKVFTPVGELSGGQQQRTAVGRALYHGGDIVLGDEPVSAVDLHQARDVLGALNDRHRTVVLAMHDVELALAFTDRVVGLQAGGIALDAPSSAIRPKDLAFLYKGE